MLKAVIGETTGGPTKAEKPRKIYPKITIFEEDLPQMDSWQIGKKYKLEVEAEFVAYRKGSEYEYENDKRNRGTLAITKVGVEEKKETFQEEYARRRSNAARY